MGPALLAGLPVQAGLRPAPHRIWVLPTNGRSKGGSKPASEPIVGAAYSRDRGHCGLYRGYLLRRQERAAALGEHCCLAANVAFMAAGLNTWREAGAASLWIRLSDIEPTLYLIRGRLCVADACQPAEFDRRGSSRDLLVEGRLNNQPC